MMELRNRDTSSIPVCGATAANSGPTALTLASAPGIVTL
jgi:hypothetical protein